MTLLTTTRTMDSECPVVGIFRRSAKSMNRHSQLQLVLFLALCMMGCTTCQLSPASNMTLNSKLLANMNQALLSPGGVFELGFWMQPNVTSPVFTLAIWYAQTFPENTVVWMADRSMNLSSNATLWLTAGGDLEVHYGGNLSAQPLWTSHTTYSNVSMATMLDTGNFVLLNRLNQIVWQSFDYPTDTLLPGQQYFASMTMFAWQKRASWTQTGYSLTWSKGNLMAYWKSPSTWYEGPYDLPYWTTSTTGSSYVVLTTEGQFLANNSFGNSSSVIGNSYDTGLTGRLRRATFDSDGILRIYSWVTNGNSKEWSVEWQALTDICSVYGVCGPYGICRSNQCLCPEGFQYVDANDPSQGCTRMTTISTLCNVDNTAFDNTTVDNITVDNNLQMIGMDNIDYPYGDYPLEPLKNVTLSFCVQICLNLCSCQACVAIPKNAGYYECWLKSDVVFNGYVRGSHTTYLKVAKTAVQAQTYGQTRGGLSLGLKLLISLILPGTALLFLSVTLWTLGCFSVVQKLRSLRIKRLEKKWIASRGMAVNFTYDEIRLATRDFAEEIGKGGYGSVFKGKIGKLAVVAVKRLEKLGAGEKGFVNEVDTIGRIHHVNLVQLHGFCSRADHKLLVYEYLENSSLDRILFSIDRKSDGPILEWRSRFKIAIQTARGLAYLHEDVRDQRIIHCDIKPENILLDSTMSAKMADFGLSRILNREQTRTMTMHIRGTSGYLAPEWTSDHMPITAKIDVYSYGMVLLEIVSGRRNLKISWIGEDELDMQPDWYYPLWAFGKIQTGSFLEVVDPRLGGIVDANEVERALLVAFWCINDNPERRPTMAMVVNMLEGHIAIEYPVPRPKFFDDILHTSTDPNSQKTMTPNGRFESTTPVSEPVLSSAGLDPGQILPWPASNAKNQKLESTIASRRL